MSSSSVIRKKLDLIINYINLKHSTIKTQFETPVKIPLETNNKSSIPERTSMLLKVLHLQNQLTRRKQGEKRLTENFETKLKDKIEESFSHKIELDQFRMEIDSIRKSESAWKKRFEQTSLKLYEEKLSILTEDLNRSRKEVNKLSICYSEIKTEKNHEILLFEDKIKTLTENNKNLKEEEKKWKEQIATLKEEKDKILKENYSATSNIELLSSSKNEQEKVIANLTRKLTTERIDSAAKIKKIEHSNGILKANFDKSLKTANGDIETLKVENGELKHKITLQQKKLDKLSKTLSCSNENLIKIQTKETEIENKLFQVTEKYKEAQEVIKDSKERNRFLAIGLKKCIEEGKLYREQIMKLDEKLNSKPISELTNINTSLNQILKKNKVLSPYSKLSKQNLIGTPTKLSFENNNRDRKI